MKYITLNMTLIFLLISALSCFGRDSVNSSVIDNDVFNAFSTNDEVPVIVLLKKTDTSPDDLEKLKHSVKIRQQEVLDNLQPDDFRLRHRYETIFGFSGFLRKGGLTKLQQNPQILHILLDKKVDAHSSDSSVIKKSGE